MSDAGRYPLCIATWTIGKPSETFIRRHVNDLLPGRTAAIAHEILPASAETWGFSGPVFPYRVPEGRWRQRVRNLAIRAGYVPPALGTFLKRHRVEVVMSEYLGSFYGLGPIFHRLGIRWYVHLHGHDVSRGLRTNAATMLAAHSAADGFIVVATCHRDRLIALGIPAAKVHVVPCGTDLPPPRLAGTTAGGVVRCAAVGRMVEKKAPLVLLEAFRRAAREDPALRLEYVGGGELFEAASRFVGEHGLEQRITLHGVRPPEFVHDLLRRSDLFLQHSVTAANGDEEGLPVAVLEGMAHGLPVISTRHAGIPDAVIDGETGCLVDEGDAAGMAAAIVHLGRDAALRTRMGEAARARVAAHFTFETERERLLRVMGLAAESDGVAA